jgi:hypothetical protein
MLNKMQHKIEINQVSGIAAALCMTLTFSQNVMAAVWALETTNVDFEKRKTK